jgi:hypothetical protein
MKALKMSLALICAAFSMPVAANAPMEEEVVEGGEAGPGWYCHYMYRIGNTDYYCCHRPIIS